MKQTAEDRAKLQAKVDQVGEMLEEFGSSIDHPIKQIGRRRELDVEALNEMPETKELIAKLQDMGIDRKWMNTYFPATGMVLIFRKESRI